MSTHLDYESESFMKTMREYADRKHDFWFEVGGRAREELLPFLSPSLYANHARLGLKPKLRRVQAALSLCLSQDMHYAVDVTPEIVRVRFAKDPFPD